MNTRDINNHGEHSPILLEFKLYPTVTPQFLTYILPLATLFPSVSSSFIRPFPHRFLFLCSFLHVVDPQGSVLGLICSWLLILWLYHPLHGFNYYLNRRTNSSYLTPIFLRANPVSLADYKWMVLLPGVTGSLTTPRSQTNPYYSPPKLFLFTVGYKLTSPETQAQFFANPFLLTGFIIPHHQWSSVNSAFQASLKCDPFFLPPLSFPCGTSPVTAMTYLHHPLPVILPAVRTSYQECKSECHSIFTFPLPLG